jgi:glucose-1-phosphate cytidylyltransferase
MYRNRGFWACMDTQRDLDYLNELWASGNAPWAVWERS